MMKLIFLLFFIAFLSNILLASALKCYKCKGNNCDDPTSVSSPETCETGGSCYWGRFASLGWPNGK